MFTISKEFHFSASHILSGLPDGHPCARMHGHNYVIVVEMSSTELNDVGFVKDYRELEPIKKWIDTYLDHQHLNDLIEFHEGIPQKVFQPNPSAEIMAEKLFSIFQDLVPDVIIRSVIVKETPKTAARFEKQL